MSTTLTRKLDAVGLGIVWSKILENFIAKGDAELNVIETVNVNGTALEVTDKGVNIVIPTGTVADLDEIGEENLSAALAALITGKAEKATTLSGYGITDAYTKEETDTQIETAVKSAVSSAYIFHGSVAFEELPTDAQTGWMYNITNAFTTTDAFNGGAGKEYPAGTNVAMDNDGKWDCMSGTYDFSNFMMKTDLVDLTEEEINAICVMPE